MSSEIELLNEFKYSTSKEASELRGYLLAAELNVGNFNSLADLLPFLEKAKESGYAYAYYMLYRMREEGLVLQKDLEEAFTLCKFSAKLGFSKAQFDLGTMYAHGLGVSVNNSEALSSYKKAAEKNYPDALLQLGVMYETGLYGTELNYELAAYYYEKSAELSSIEATVSLANLYRKGDGVKKDLSRAIELYEKAAKNGSIDAHIQLGLIYNTGDAGVPRDTKKANTHLSIAEKLQANMERSIGLDDN